MIHGVLLTDEKPRYIARASHGRARLRIRVQQSPIEGQTHKIAARYLAPYLERLNRRGVPA